MATRHAWQALTAAQRATIHQAIMDTLGHAEIVLAPNETQELSQLCSTGVVLDQPSPAQLAMLARQAGGTPAGAAASAITRMIRADVPGTGPQPSPVPLPAPCRTAQTPAQAISLHGRTVPAVSGTHGATIPPGNYVTTDTVADFQANGVTRSDFSKPVTYTYHFHADGEVEESQVPEYPDNGTFYGRYVVHGNEVTFYWNAASGLTPETVRWSYYDGQLTFSVVVVQDAAGQVMYNAHPWRKVS